MVRQLFFTFQDHVEADVVTSVDRATVASNAEFCQLVAAAITHQYVVLIITLLHPPHLQVGICLFYSI